MAPASCPNRCAWMIQMPVRIWRRMVAATHCLRSSPKRMRGNPTRMRTRASSRSRQNDAERGGFGHPVFFDGMQNRVVIAPGLSTCQSFQGIRTIADGGVGGSGNGPAVLSLKGLENRGGNVQPGTTCSAPDAALGSTIPHSACHQSGRPESDGVRRKPRGGRAGGGAHGVLRPGQVPLSCSAGPVFADGS